MKQEEEKHMKKRMISLMLTLSILFGAVVPAMTPQADAVIGTIIGTGVKILASVARGCAQSLEDDKAGKYDSKGKAVLGCFTNIGKDLLGMGGSSGSGDNLYQVDLTEVNEALAAINGKLDEQQAAIYQVHDTVTNGIQQLTGEMSNLEAKLSGMSTQIENTAQRQEYYTYLNTFFDFFNQYFESLTYYDKRVTPMLSAALSSSGGAYAVDTGKISQDYQKNVFDQFYQLNNVRYTGDLHSAVANLSSYLQGTYVSANGGSITSILSEYYYLALLGADTTEEKKAEARANAAAKTEDMIGYIYYAYITGVYYEQAMALYHTAYMDENETDIYTTYSGIQISRSDVEQTISDVVDDLAAASGQVLLGMREIYSPTATMDMVYGTAEGGYLLTRPLSMQYKLQNGTLSGSADPMAVEYGGHIWMPDPAYSLRDYFSADFCAMFEGIATYQEEEGGSLFEIDGNLITVKSDASAKPTSSLHLMFGSADMGTVSFRAAEKPQNFAAGLGTADFPYLIETPEQYVNIFYSSYMNQTVFGEPNPYFVLGKDLDFADRTTTIPVMTEFSGTFDGAGHAIRNVRLTSMTTTADSGPYLGVDWYSGLFGKVSGTIRNLRVENTTLSVAVGPDVPYDSNRYSGKIHAGILAGALTETGTIENCQITGCSASFTIAPPTGNKTVNSSVILGGVVGMLKGKMNGVACVDTSVNASSSATDLNLTYNDKVPRYYQEGSLMAGGLAGVIAGSSAVMSNSGYMVSSKDFAGNITAEGIDVTSAGGLVGRYEEASTIQDSWVMLNKMPVGSTVHSYIDGQETIVAYQYGTLIGTTDQNGTPVLSKVTGCKFAQQIPFSTRGTDELIGGGGKLATPDNVFILMYTPIRDSLSDEAKRIFSNADRNIVKLDFGYGNDALTKELMTLPHDLGCTTEDYVNLSGLKPYQALGGKKLDQAAYYIQLKEGDSVLNPAEKLTEGTHTVTVTQYNGGTVSFDIKVAKEDHYYVSTSTKKATCTEAGTADLYCLNCGDVKTGQEIAALGHKEVTVPGYPATCTAKGLTDGKFCTRCNQETAAQEPIPLLEHTLDAGTVVAEATCIASGLKQYSCTECGRLVRSETVPATGHSYAATVNDPTCDTPGFTTHTCSACGDTYTDGYVAPTGHSYDDGTVTKKATCQALGEITYACTECGKSYTAPIPKAEHDFVADTVVEPGCDTEGYTIYKCSYGCGASEKRDFVQPTEHAYDSGTITKAATCTEEGEITYKCIHPDCTNSYTQPIPMIPHNYTETVTEPTCEEMGYTTRTCTECGDSYQTDFRNPVGHEYDQGTVTTAPTCKDEGVRTFNCVHGCGKTYTQPEPKLQHDYGAAVTEPTCEELGYTLYTCKVCGDSYMDLYTAAKGHSWGPGETVKAPTLTETGLLKQTCTLCQKTQETVIPCLDQCDGIHCPSAIFNDVKGPQNWSHVGIDYVVAMKLFNGTGATTFSPDANMTRAMLVTVLYRMEGSPSVEGMQNPFGDVAAGSWYADAVIWAADQGVVNGMTSTTFQPNSSITREQTATILFRYAQKKGCDVTAQADLSEFIDQGKVSAYAEDALRWANAAGLINGSQNGDGVYLMPRDYATRAQLAAILMRYQRVMAA